MNELEGVKTFRREECSVLSLVLKKKWFDLIGSGEKKEEYRTSKSVCRQIERWLGHSVMFGKKLVVEFFLGYAKDRKRMCFFAEEPYVYDRSDSPEWGEPDVTHYVIPLLERAIDVKDIEHADSDHE